MQPLRWDWIISGSTSLTSRIGSSALAPSRTCLQSNMRCSKLAGFWNSWYFVEISLSFLCSHQTKCQSHRFLLPFITLNIKNLNKEISFDLLTLDTEITESNRRNNYQHHPVGVSVTCSWSNMVAPRAGFPSAVGEGKLVTFLRFISSTVSSWAAISAPMVCRKSNN